MSEQILSVGRTPEVSDKAIIVAGQALIEAGRRVTGFALRKGVGNKGDPKRLHRVWEAHFSLSHESNDDTDNVLPFELNEHLEDATQNLTQQLNVMVIRLNRIAIHASEQRVASAVQLANEREESAEAEVHDAMLTIDDLEKQLSVVSREHVQAKTQLDEQAIKHDSLSGEMNGLSMLNEDLNEQLRIEKLKAKELSKDIESSTVEINQLLIQVADLKSDKLTLKSEVEVLITQIKETSDERSKLLDRLMAFAEPVRA